MRASNELNYATVDDAVARRNCYSKPSSRAGGTRPKPKARWTACPCCGVPVRVPFEYLNQEVR